jgi:mono/diheme cytochrome c family protein
MKNRIIFLSFAAIVAALAVGGCGSFSLAADVTPPPDYVAATAVPTRGVEVVEPARPINIGQGEVIYLEKCAPCHGETGMGDGPQATDLPAPVPALVSVSMFDAAAPQDWYGVTVAGRMDRFMPPFTSLTPGQVWDVIGYIYTLDKNAETISAGKGVFDAECKACHGALGKGDGPDAAGLSKSPPDFSDPAVLMSLSQQEVVAIIAGGKGTLMPAFASRLDQESLRAAASHIRRLGFAETAAEQAAPLPAPAPTENESAASLPDSNADGNPEADAAAKNADSATASIRAVLTIPSGGDIPKGLTASLVAYDAMQPVFTIDKKVGADNSAQWDDIEVRENRVYLVNIAHNGVVFRSQVLHGTDMKPGEVNDAFVEVFETTTDNSKLSAERVHIFFDFPSEDRLQVVQMFLVANPGPAMVIPALEGKSVIEFNLPPDYANLQFESGELGGRFVQTADGFGDTSAVQPGSASHQVLFAYELAYNKSAVVPLHLPLKATNAILLTPDGGVRLEAEGLQDAGARAMQEGDMRIYALNNLAAGSTLQVKVTGLPGQRPVSGSESTTGMFVGGGLLVAVLVGIAVWLIRRKEPAEEITEEELKEDDSVESLVDAIIALDDLHQAGKIPADAYKERRAELKERLRAAREH